MDIKCNTEKNRIDIEIRKINVFFSLKKQLINSVIDSFTILWKGRNFIL